MPSVLSAAASDNLTLVTTADTTMVTMPPYPTNNPAGAGTLLRVVAEILPGAGTTDLVAVLRRDVDGVTTTVRTSEAIAVSASAATIIVIDAIDSYTGPGNPVYSASVSQTAATGNGTVNYVTMSAEALAEG